MPKKTIRIITRAGDGGMTALADGKRVSKTSVRIRAMGDIDELNSLIGLLACENLHPEIIEELFLIQNDLFNIGAGLAGIAQQFVTDEQVLRLESQAEKYDAGLLPLKEFILPGGSRSGAFFHVARSVCRRAERSVFAVKETGDVSGIAGKYLNRLSDLLFIYARTANKQAGAYERLWQKNKNDIK